MYKKVFFNVVLVFLSDVLFTWCSSSDLFQKIGLAVQQKQKQLLFMRFKTGTTPTDQQHSALKCSDCPEAKPRSVNCRIYDSWHRPQEGLSEVNGLVMGKDSEMNGRCDSNSLSESDPWGWADCQVINDWNRSPLAWAEALRSHCFIRCCLPSSRGQWEQMPSRFSAENHQWGRRLYFVAFPCVTHKTVVSLRVFSRWQTKRETKQTGNVSSVFVL